MGSALNLPRGNLFNVDPHDDICIITAVKRDDAGPKDKVDPKHYLVEKHERDVTNEEIASINAKTILQPIVALRDGSDMVIVIAGRRRVRMARIVNDLRYTWNKGGTNWLFPTKRADGEKEMPTLTVPVTLKQGTPVELRSMMIIENVQRADYSPSQMAGEIKDLLDMGATPDQAAEACGQKMWFVEAHMALFDCAESVRSAVDAGTITVTAAKKLSEIPRDAQEAALTKAVAEGGKMTVVGAKRAVKGHKTGKGAEADNAPSKGEVARMLILVQNDKDMTPKEREVAGEVLAWVRNGKRPKSFTLPRLSTKLPEKAGK